MNPLVSESIVESKKTDRIAFGFLRFLAVAALVTGMAVGRTGVARAEGDTPAGAQVAEATASSSAAAVDVSVAASSASPAVDVSATASSASPADFLNSPFFGIFQKVPRVIIKTMRKKRERTCYTSQILLERHPEV